MFRSSESVVNPPLDFQKDTEMLESVCHAFCQLDSVSSHITQVQRVSDFLGVESPLTPPENINETNSIGETFTKVNPVVVCTCKSRCTSVGEYPDFYSGKCGDRVVSKSPFSYIHVNLSRKLPSGSQLAELLRPLFTNVKLRMVPGDSGGSVVLLTRDKQEERQIRRILRSGPVRLDKGIRIFQVTQQDPFTHR